jgi:ferredoxin-NADP reductase
MVLQEFEGNISRIENITDSVKNFTITFDKQLEFKAGQFVNLVFDNPEGGRPIMKSYSIASAPFNKNEIELCIKLVENGALTPKLFKMRTGEKIKFKGPFGLFNLENSNSQKLVFIGTGTGITPLRSMILDLLENNTQELLEEEEEEKEVIVEIKKEITLIFGCRYENEILFQKEFKELEEKNPNFKFLPVVSKPTEKWIGRMNHVQDNFESIDINNSDFFVCGLNVMIDEVENKLISLGVSKDKIHFERYG